MLDLFTVGRLVDMWLAEDIGHGDLTALSMIEPDAKATFHMNAREELSLAGVDVAAMCFKRYDPNVSVEVKASASASASGSAKGGTGAAGATFVGGPASPAVAAATGMVTAQMTMQ